MTAEEIVIKNYGMAAGRIGLAAVMLPLLLGLGTLFLVDEHGSTVTAAMLYALSLPFIWYAVTVPLWLSFGNVVEVRRLFGVREYQRSDLAGIESSVIRSRMGLGRLMPWWELGIRSYPIGILHTRQGRKITFRARITEIDRIRQLITPTA